VDRTLVLIVDDEEPIRALCRVNLELNGYDVAEAADGAEAVAIAAKHQPGVVLLDVLMPVLDGWSTLQRLKGDPRTAELPVVMLTALTSEEDQLQAWQGGVVDFVSKPFTPDQLVSAVRRAERPHDPEQDEAARAGIIERLASLVEQRRNRRRHR
jgi:CheY-like chemotaxis protein